MKIALMVLALASVSAGYARDAAAEFEKANQLYRNSEFAKAAEAYERVVSGGDESAALYFNMGNCYFKLKNWPDAILNYERARRLSPRDEDIAYNLRLANLHVVDRIEAIPPLFFVEWWRSFVNWTSADGWGLFAVGALWCSALAAGALMLARPAALRKASALLVVLSLAGTALSSLAAVERSRIEQGSSRAVVFSPSVAVKSSPDEHGTDLFVLHEGITVETLDAVETWTKIRLPDGKVGWIPLEAVKII